MSESATYPPSPAAYPDVRVRRMDEDEDPLAFLDRVRKALEFAGKQPAPCIYDVLGLLEQEGNKQVRREDVLNVVRRWVTVV